MNTDNNLTPDDGYRKTWQQAFDEAAETPPPRVWNAIERQLDTDNRARIIPLWAYVKPWATGVAASVAFVLTGWWAWQGLDTQCANGSGYQSSSDDRSTRNRSAQPSASSGFNEGKSTGSPQ